MSIRAVVVPMRAHSTRKSVLQNLDGLALAARDHHVRHGAEHARAPQRRGRDAERAQLDQRRGGALVALDAARPQRLREPGALPTSTI